MALVGHFTSPRSPQWTSALLGPNRGHLRPDAQIRREYGKLKWQKQIVESPTWITRNWSGLQLKHGDLERNRCVAMQCWISGKVNGIVGKSYTWSSIPVGAWKDDQLYQPSRTLDTIWKIQLAREDISPFIVANKPKGLDYPGFPPTVCIFILIATLATKKLQIRVQLERTNSRILRLLLGLWMEKMLVKQ